MTAFAPFTAHIKVVPGRGQTTKLPNTANSAVVSRRGSRFDHYRELQRLAVLVYDELRENVDVTSTDSIELATPGGGQFRLRSSADSQWSDYANGMGVVPQFGNKPALLMVEGFYRSPSMYPSTQPAPRLTRIAGNDFYQGFAGDQPWLGSSGQANTTVEAEVTAIKSAIEGAISTVSDSSGVALGLFRLEYKNITWGDRGHHFPQ